MRNAARRRRKKAGCAILAGLLFVLAGSPARSARAAAEGPYAQAQVGDWIAYKVLSEQNGRKSEYTLKETVVERNADSVTVETTTTVKGQSVSRRHVFHLAGKVKRPKIGKKIKKERLGEGDEAIAVGGRSFPCHWTQWKITVQLGENAIVTKQKIWSSPKVPLGGTVKVRYETPNGTSTRLLTSFGRKKKE